jgi:hypothetical protein
LAGLEIGDHLDRRIARHRPTLRAKHHVLIPDFLFEIEAIAFMMAATPVFMRL